MLTLNRNALTTTLATKRLRSAVAGVALALCAVISAPAQVNLGTLAPKETLTQADKDEIKRQVDKAAPMLASGDASDVKRAREMLTDAFEAKRVSVGFRVEAARQMLPALTPIIAGQRELAAVNALRVAGEAATSNSLTVVLGSLKDPRTSVRIGASYALSRLFMQAARTAPAVTPGDTSRALQAIEAYIAAEADPMALDTAISAMVAAGGVPGGEDASIRISNVVIAKINGKYDSPDNLALAFRAVREMRSQFTAAGATVSPAAASAAAAVAAELLKCIQAQMTTANATTLQTAAGAAETTITLASTTLRGPDIAGLNLGLVDAVKAGNAEAFTAALNKLTPVLKAAPFNVK